MAEGTRKDPLEYKREYNEFMYKLRRFLASKDMPMRKLPLFGGEEIDLYLLYKTVTNIGGWLKVTDEKKWHEVTQCFNLPSSCVNAAFALRQLYVRYLEGYEKLYFLGEDGDDTAFPRLNSYFNIGSMSSRTAPTYRDPHKNFERLVLSLQSGLPNEVDFAINICMLLSNVNNSVFNLAKAPAVVDMMLAHVGVFSEDSYGSSNLYKEWYKKSSKDFLKFWLRVLNCEEIKELLPKHEASTTSLDQFCPDEIFNLDKTAAHADFELQRVLQVCTILHNFSFDKMDASVLASHPVCLRFLLFCLHSNIGSLKKLATDTMTNLAEKMVLEPLESLNSQLFFFMIDRYVRDSDRYNGICAMNILKKICLLEENQDLVCKALDIGTYEALVKLLILEDVQLLVPCLETLYQLTALGQVPCDQIVTVERSIEILVSILRVCVETFGASTLSQVKIVDNYHGIMPSGVAGKHSPAKMFVNSPEQVQRADAESEGIAQHWLRSAYDVDPTHTILQRELYSDYLTSCGKRTRNAILNSPSFYKILRCVFPDLQVVKLHTGNQQLYGLVGIRKKVSSEQFFGQTTVNHAHRSPLSRTPTPLLHTTSPTARTASPPMGMETNYPKMGHVPRIPTPPLPREIHMRTDGLGTSASPGVPMGAQSSSLPGQRHGVVFPGVSPSPHAVQPGFPPSAVQTQTANPLGLSSQTSATQFLQAVDSRNNLFPTSAFHGTTSALPGTTSAFPGTTSAFLGTTSPFPGTASAFPGPTSPFSGTTSVISGTTSVLPGTTSAIPGTTSAIPGTGPIVRPPNGTNNSTQVHSSSPGDQKIPSSSTVLVQRNIPAVGSTATTHTPGGRPVARTPDVVPGGAGSSNGAWDTTGGTGSFRNPLPSEHSVNISVSNPSRTSHSGVAVPLQGGTQSGNKIRVVVNGGEDRSEPVVSSSGIPARLPTVNGSETNGDSDVLYVAKEERATKLASQGREVLISVVENTSKPTIETNNDLELAKTTSPTGPVPPLKRPKPLLSDIPTENSEVQSAVIVNGPFVASEMLRNVAKRQRCNSDGGSLPLVNGVGSGNTEQKDPMAWDEVARAQQKAVVTSPKMPSAINGIRLDLVPQLAQTAGSKVASGTTVVNNTHAKTNAVFTGYNIQANLTNTIGNHMTSQPPVPPNPGTTNHGPGTVAPSSAVIASRGQNTSGQAVVVNRTAVGSTTSTPAVLPQSNTSEDTCRSVEVRGEQASGARDPYRCMWSGCSCSFINSKLLYNHAVSTHAPTDQLFTSCQWEGCSHVRRARASLLFHLRQRHLSPVQPTAATDTNPIPKPQKAPPVGPMPSSQPAPAPVHGRAVYPPHPSVNPLLMSLKEQLLQTEQESALTKSVRLTAALILRNIAKYSPAGRRKLKRFESSFAEIMCSKLESNGAMAACLHEMNRRRQEKDSGPKR